jgi:hypothetical protein
MIDCLFFAAGTLIVSLLIIYVAVPKIAQNEINSSTLEVTAQEVTNPNATGLHLKLDSVIRSGSSFHPIVDSFRASLTLDGQNEPFIYVQVPEVKSEAETFVTIDQDVIFTSLDAFSRYTKVSMTSDTFNVKLDGKTNIHLKGLPTMAVNYNKVLSMKGQFDTLFHLYDTNIAIQVSTNCKAWTSLPSNFLLALPRSYLTARTRSAQSTFPTPQS